MAEIRTVKEEKQAIVDLVASLDGIKQFYTFEPKEIGATPACTVQFMGFEPPTPANFRTTKQVRLYEVRLYVSLENMELAQDVLGDLLTRLWERLTTAQRLGDPENVILSYIGKTEVLWVADGNTRAYIEGKIQLQIEHRSAYSADGIEC